MKSIDSKILDWFISGKGGESSKCMAAHLTGRKGVKCHPSDQGDFMRCLGLLDAVPELRGRLGKMSAVSKQWEALVNHWDAIEKKVGGGDRQAYEFMRQILDPIDEGDLKIIRVGAGVSIHF